MDSTKPAGGGPLWRARKRLESNLRRLKMRVAQAYSWRHRHRSVFKLNPEYLRQLPKDVRSEHLRVWRRLRRQIDPRTLELCFNISGRADPRIVPEDLFAADIEPALNRHPVAEFLANKAIYEHWFGPGVFPPCLFCKLDGQFYDADFQMLATAEVQVLLQGLASPMVFKPCMYSSGGANVRFPMNSVELQAAMEGQDNYVVQTKIIQHPFFARLNPDCLNTVRVCTYRSVANHRLHVLNAASRIGRRGTLDNETSGGLVRCLHADGRMNEYAVDKYGRKYFGHPDSNLAFTADEFVPHFEEMQALALRVAARLPLVRLASLDLTLDADGRWQVIELNLFSQTIRFAQYAGQPFFGPFTEEVIEYCRNHPYQF